MSLKAGLGQRGEFDEIYLSNASVHIERMDTRAFWMRIEAEDGREVVINTGIADGKWFFNVEEDAVGGDWLAVERPACHRKHGGSK